MQATHNLEPAGEPVRAEALLAPVPDFSELRHRKDGYRNWPIDEHSPIYNQELVDIHSYKLAGQAYYSRPNAATDQPVGEVPRGLFIRKGVAEKLRSINEQLRNPIFTDFFDGPVELYIEDGHRSYELQKNLFEKVFPHLIWQQNPGITDVKLNERLKGLIAEPSNDSQHPSPHATGGAVDVILRYQQQSQYYVKGSEVYVGHIDGDTSERVLPDHFEINEPQTDQDKLAQRNRRALYAIMTGQAFGQVTDLQVNPTEWWHWSYGDQMWAKLQDKPAALYGLA